LVAVEAGTKGGLDREDGSGDVDVPVVLVDGSDVQAGACQPGLHGRDGRRGGTEALEVPARREEVTILRTPRGRDGQRELLQLGQTSVRCEVDPSLDGRTRRSVPQLRCVSEP